LSRSREAASTSLENVLAKKNPAAFRPRGFVFTRTSLSDQMGSSLFSYQYQP
jgi:hypothetical protein